MDVEAQNKIDEDLEKKAQEKAIAESQKKPPEREITDEQIAQNFSAMDDSVKLINEIVADDSKEIENMHGDPEEVKRHVERNTRHLENQAKRYWYKDSDKSKTAYDNAVTVGKAYVAG